MKTNTILFTILLCLLFQTSYAQEETFDNGFVLGGSFNYKTKTNGLSYSIPSINSSFGGIAYFPDQESKGSIFSFTPYVGKNINNHILIGLGLDYRIGNNKTKLSSSVSFPDPTIYITQIDTKSNQIGAELFARYTFAPQNKLRFYLQPYLGYSLLKEEKETFGTNPNNKEQEVSYINTGIDIGLSYDINNKFAVLFHSGGLRYVNGKYKEKDTNESKDFSSFGINFSLSNIYFGLEMKL